MVKFKIIQDRIVPTGETNRLGLSVKEFLPSNEPKIPEDYDGWIPFTRFCFSIGDIGIISGLFEALKQKYPKAKIAFPSDAYIRNLIPNILPSYTVGPQINAFLNIENILKNNKNIDYRFNPGDFDYIFSDHDRVYKDILEEPLVEQLLRRFGFNDDDLIKIDSRPKLYFSEEEVSKYKKNKNKFIKDKKYGCLLFSSRTKKLKSSLEELNALEPAAKLYKNYPVFYYSDYDLKGTIWEKYFPKMINFKDTKFNIREQLYIKYNALFNISVHAGMSDATSGYTDYHAFTQLETPRENVMRGATYYFKNGDIKKY